MPDAKTRVAVNIFDQEYIVRGEDSEVHIKALASKVDGMMRHISDKTYLPQTKVAVLTALNLANELDKLRQEHQELLELLEEGKG